MQEEEVSKCIFKRGTNTLTWKKSYMKSQTILIDKKIYLDLQQKAEVFIFLFFFKFKPSGFRAGHFNNCLVSWVMFFTPERLLETSVLGLFLFAMM